MVKYVFGDDIGAERRTVWTYASLEATRTLIETGETRSIDSEHKKVS